MKTCMAMILTFCILGGCTENSSPTSTEVLMSPVPVGTKTPDYEVVSPTELVLASGVRLQILEGADGQDNGFVLFRNNGGIGGFMACGCVGAQTGNCVTVNDNPQHPECSGSCSDSEGNILSCQIEGPIIGPPRDPFHLKFVAAP